MLRHYGHFVLSADLSAQTNSLYSARVTGTPWGHSALYGVRTNATALTVPPVSHTAQFTKVSQNNTDAGVVPGRIAERNEDLIATQDWWGAGIPVDLVKNYTYTRSGGATDGHSSFSYAMGLTSWLAVPFCLDYWNTKTDESFLVTFDYEWSSTSTGLTALRTEDIWIEAVYYNHPTRESMDLVFSFDKYNRRGLIHNGPTPTAATTSAATWAGALGSAVKQKISVTVSPKKAGIIRFYIGAWRCPWTQNLCSIASTSPLTVYFDPLPTLSAAP